MEWLRQIDPVLDELMPLFVTVAIVVAVLAVVRALVSPAAVASVAVLVLQLAATAQAEAGVSGDLDSLGDDEVVSRLAFLEERLDAGRRHAQVWQWGFTGIYVAGVVVGTAIAATTDDSDERVAEIVGASKAAIASADMWIQPHPARMGANPSRQAGSDPRARLAAAEAQLVAVVERTDGRFDWLRHAQIILLNAAGGVIVGLLGDTSDAAIDAAVGLVVGEIATFTQPWGSNGDLDAYRKSFRIDTRPSLTWRLAPLASDGAHGLSLSLRF